MNKEIQPTNQNAKIIADHLADEIKQAMIKKYGKPLFTFESNKSESAQSIIDNAEDAYR